MELFPGSRRSFAINPRIRYAAIAAAFALMLSPARATVQSGSADLVLGQAHFNTGNINAFTLNPAYPEGIALDPSSGRIFVADPNNNRVLWWNNRNSLENGQTADGVLGQSTFVGQAAGCTQYGMHYPSGVAVDGSGNVWVADALNNRVLEFSGTLSNGMNASLVLGQSNFTSNAGVATQSGMFYPYGVAVDGSGNVWVADTVNSRVLEYSGTLSNGMNASLVLGQPNFTSTTNSPTAQSGMNSPFGVVVDISGNVWVADCGDHRVLEYSGPLSNGMNATLVLGQPNFTSGGIVAVSQSSLGGPVGVAVDRSGNVWVADRGNSRVLEYSGTLSNGMNATLVVGQGNFTSVTNTTTPSGTNNIWGVAVDGLGNVWVADSGNSRVLEYSGTLSSGMNASLVLGQPGFTTGNPYILNGQGLNYPSGVALDQNSGRMFLADTFNNRVLWWNNRNALSSGQSADGVLGQPDLYHSAAATTQAGMNKPFRLTVDSSGNVWVADYGNNRVLEFSGTLSNGMNASLVLGQPNFTSNTGAVTQAGLTAPLGVTVDGSGNVWVADYNSNRVLEYSGTLSNGMNASLVLGQSNFTSAAAATSQSGMNTPAAVTVDGSGNVWVADLRNHRVLEFSGTLSNGMNAALVLGQSNFTGNAAAITQSGMRYPESLTVDGLGHVWVADTNNNRVLEFIGPFSNGMNASSVFGQPDFTSNSNLTSQSGMYLPFSVAVDSSGNVWTADCGNSRLLEFQEPPVTTAPSVNAVALGVSSISWSWSALTNATSYKAFEASSTTTFLGSVTGSPFSLTGLSNNTAYGIVVEGLNFGGIAGPLSAAVTGYTLAAPATGFVVTQVSSSTVSLSWGANTNPASTTSYRVDYWQATGSTTSLPTTALTQESATGLSPATTYYFTVTALNGSGVATPSGVVLSTMTTGVKAAVGSSGVAVSFTPPPGPVTVTIPPGAFAFPVNMTLASPASFPAGGGPAATLTGTGVGVQITLDQAVQPAVGARLAVSYRLSDVVGMDQNTLILSRYDDTAGVWVPLVSSIDLLNRIVMAQTNHFSTFQIMAAAPSGTVSTAKVFPNPLRPSLGQTLMTFSNLPASARIRIYNLKGVLIKDMTANASGMASWDATNQSGSPVSSGVYFVYAQGAGQSRTFEAAVQR